MKKRGIVIYPVIDVAQNYFQPDLPKSEGKSVHIEYTMDPALLSMYALYWDLIDLPENNLIKLFGDGPLGGDFGILEKEGILKRSKIMFRQDAFDASLPFAVQVIALLENSKNTNEEWALGQKGFKLILPPDHTIDKRTVEVELYRALPVPHESVSIEDVIKFKRKRRDELYRFRHALDDLYLQVIQSRDIPRAKSHAIDEVHQSLIALNKVMKERRIPLIRPSIKVELNISDLILFPTAGSIAATQFNFPPQVGAVIGLAAAALKCKVSISPTLKDIPSNLRDYAYLANVEKKLQKRRRRRRSSKQKRRNRILATSDALLIIATLPNNSLQLTQLAGLDLEQLALTVKVTFHRTISSTRAPSV